LEDKKTSKNDKKSWIWSAKVKETVEKYNGDFEVYGK
jgi:hypothetical protein